MKYLYRLKVIFFCFIIVIVFILMYLSFATFIIPLLYWFITGKEYTGNVIDPLMGYLEYQISYNFYKSEQ